MFIKQVLESQHTDSRWCRTPQPSQLLTFATPDLTNFEDPLNIEAADHYRADREGFRNKVREWVAKFAKR